MAPFCVSISLFLRQSLNHLASWGLELRAWPSLTLSTSCKVNVPPGSPRALLLKASSAQASMKCPHFVHQPCVCEERLWQYSVCVYAPQSQLVHTRGSTNSITRQIKKIIHRAALLSGNSDAKSLEGGHGNVSDNKAWTSR